MAKRTATAAAKAIDSGRGLARALGVGESTVREYLGRPDWPVGRRGPWPPAAVAKALAWRRGLQEDRAADAAPGASRDGGGPQIQELGVAQKVNLAAKNEQMLLTRTKREKLQGTLVSRDLLDAALRGLARMFVGALEELERSLPYQLAGRSAGEVEREIGQRIHAVRAQLAGQTVIELQQVEQRIAADALPKARGRPASRA